MAVVFCTCVGTARGESQEITTPKPPHILPRYSCIYPPIQKRCIVGSSRCIDVTCFPWGGKSNLYDAITSLAQDKTVRVRYSPLGTYFSLFYSSFGADYVTKIYKEYY